jgi:hypothetical protein
MEPEHNVPPQEQENFLHGMINENRSDPNNDDLMRMYLNESGEGDESLNREDGSGEIDQFAYNGEEADEGEADEGEADGSGGTLNLGEVYTYVLFVIEMQLSIYIHE